jgi:HD-GYP domain-containing protein (c-di-GMP phosphodiesterase class II)
MVCRPMNNVAPHRDMLEMLNQDLPLKEKLVSAHDAVKIQFPFIQRIAIALYDNDTSMLKTYIHSSNEDNPLDNYETHIDNAPSLKTILDKGLPRVINKMVTMETSKNEHTKRIGRQGYAASYTLPMFNNGVFFGFIFYNSDKSDVFNEKILSELDLYGHLLSLMVIHEISNIQTLTAAIKTTGKISHVRDEETGSHLDRMSRFSRIIALELAETHSLDDDYIEHIFMFSPLHDIGKIGIPDNILLKPGKLDDEERVIMNTHTTIGGDMIDDLIDNFHLKGLEHIDILRNIALYHHEAVNGKGYPHGLNKDDIPLEARIVAVADVFDALTSKRSYKDAWSNEKAVEILNEMAGEQLDVECVQALLNQLDKVVQIQEQFKEDPYG